MRSRLLLCLSLLSLSFSLPLVAQGRLSLDKAAFAPGEKIAVHFTASSDWPRDAWVGMFQAKLPHGSEAENDKVELSYQYLEKRASGTLEFQAPGEMGNYDFRMHDTDQNGREVASVAFAVGGGTGTLRLDKSNFTPGEEIALRFTAAETWPRDAWVGMFDAKHPHGSEAKNDEVELAYQYLEKKTSGTLAFKAPAEPGSYDFRLHDTDQNGREVAQVAFTVGRESAGAKLSLGKTTYAPGESIALAFTAPASWDRDAWVGMFDAKHPHGSEAKNDEVEIGYQYLEKKTSGTLAFKAPAEPGSYDFRMHDTDNNGSEVAQIAFTVQKGGEPDKPGTLRLDKAAYAPGESITVTFTAPASWPRDAWVGMFQAKHPHGSEAENDKVELSYQYLEKKTSGTLAFKAPAEAGSYDFRMHDTDSDGREVAQAAFTVQKGGEPDGAATLRLDKAAYAPGENIAVSFTAPASWPRDAWVGMFQAKHPHGSEAENDKVELSYQYLEKKTSGTLAFKAPAEPGSYDFRMHDTDSDGREVAQAAFTVGTGVVPPSGMTLEAASRQVRQGDSVTIPVSLIGGRDVANMNFNLTYSQEIARVSGPVIKGNLLDKAMFEANPNDVGVVRIGFAQSQDLSGTGTVAQIPFKAVGPPGSRTWLRLEVTTINSATGAKTPIATVAGDIQIVRPEEKPPGDLNGNGILDAGDALDALKMSVRLILVNMAADMDADGQVTSNDARLILLKVVGK